jgi:hypothetical protein
MFQPFDGRSLSETWEAVILLARKSEPFRQLIEATNASGCRRAAWVEMAGTADGHIGHLVDTIFAVCWRPQGDGHKPGKLKA